jgi:hypothetical protein
MRQEIYATFPSCSHHRIWKTIRCHPGFKCIPIDTECKYVPVGLLADCKGECFFGCKVKAENERTKNSTNNATPSAAKDETESAEPDQEGCLFIFIVLWREPTPSDLTDKA